MSNKITLKEFFDSEEMLAIHCNTEEKANKLLKEFDKLGKVWRNGDKYIETNKYITYNNSTCYTNEGSFCSFDYYLNRNYKIYEFDDIIFEEQPKNLIPLIAKELGVEIGEEFKVYDKPYTFKFTDDELVSIEDDGSTYKANATFFALISGREDIIKLPKKPKLTEAEKVILENLPKEYEYIVRDYSEVLYVSVNKPKKDGNRWIDYTLNDLRLFQHLFQFIKWEDEEPYKIQELLEEYENLRSE